MISKGKIVIYINNNTTPAFEKNITEKENRTLAEKLKVYDFVTIYE